MAPPNPQSPSDIRVVYMITTYFDLGKVMFGLRKNYNEVSKHLKIFIHTESFSEDTFGL